MATVIATCSCFFFQAEDGIRDLTVTGVQTCALPILLPSAVCVPRTWTKTPLLSAPTTVAVLTFTVSAPSTKVRAVVSRLLSVPRTSTRSEEHTSELQSQSNLVCRLLLDKKKTK